MCCVTLRWRSHECTVSWRPRVSVRNVGVGIELSIPSRYVYIYIVSFHFALVVVALDLRLTFLLGGNKSDSPRRALGDRFALLRGMQICIDLSL